MMEQPIGRYEIEIPEDVTRMLEEKPDKPGQWVTPEILEIIRKYGGKKTFRDIAEVIRKCYGVSVNRREVQYMYHKMMEEDEGK